MTSEDASVYGTVEEASIRTGCSVSFILSGCQDGRIPCIKNGREIRVNIPAMMQQTNFFDALQEGRHSV